MTGLARWTIAMLLAAAWLGAGCGDDDGSGCPTECEPLGQLRCFGTQIQSCGVVGDCDLWTLVQDCAATDRICMEQGDGPYCGILCTDPCQLGQQRCQQTVAQSCAENPDGCLFWDDLLDCADSGEICDDSTGDATCITQ